jgi:acetyl esterase/lipase
MTMLRRMLVAVVACLMCAGAFAQQPAAANNAPLQSIDLWPAGAPADSGSAPRGPERVGQTGTGVGAVSNISEPRMVIYRPPQPNGTAVLIIGGGGYFRIGIGNESEPTAQWLAALGITPVILYYRLPSNGWKAVAPFQDGQRAMRLLRARAGELGIDPHRIGVIGFSAGGNLAGILATRSGDAFYPPVDAADQQSARPDFAGLIYPVSSLQPPYDTTRSVRELTTQSDAVTAYTVQLHVTHDTPPTFIAHAADDPIVHVGSSLALFEVLHQQQVPVELHVFEKGGHGWGLGQPGTLVAAWPRLFMSWAREHAFVPAGMVATPYTLPRHTQKPAKSDNSDDSDDSDG